jgi:hypothetical protein
MLQNAGNPCKCKKKAQVHFTGSYNALSRANVMRPLFVLNFIFWTIVCTCTADADLYS